MRFFSGLAKHLTEDVENGLWSSTSQDGYTPVAKLGLKMEMKDFLHQRGPMKGRPRNANADLMAKFLNGHVRDDLAADLGGFFGQKTIYEHISALVAGNPWESVTRKMATVYNPYRILVKQPIENEI